MLTLTALIPTLGRTQEVIHTVQALLKQSRLPDEILVVDQNRPSLEVLDRYLASVPLVRHIHSNGNTVVDNVQLTPSDGAASARPKRWASSGKP